MALEIIHIIEDYPAQARLLGLSRRYAWLRIKVACDGPAGVQDV